MDATTDHLIVFFGYSATEKINFSIDPTSVNIQKICPVCGAQMKLREGRYGEFLGCSRYPNCKQTAKLTVVGRSIS